MIENLTLVQNVLTTKSFSTINVLWIIVQDVKSISEMDFATLVKIPKMLLQLLEVLSEVYREENV
jgi:hypothetical protein